MEKSAQRRAKISIEKKMADRKTVRPRELWDKDMSRVLPLGSAGLWDKLRLYDSAEARFCKERSGTCFVERIFF
jgi:hypothetical protein